jgi:predicted phosphodiesterase
MDSKKIIFLLILLSCFTFSSFASNNFHFAILSDRTGGADQEAFEKVLFDIKNLHPDFIVTVGDLVEDGRKLEDWIIPMKSLEIFECPIYFTPGNHDILDEESEKIYTEKTGFDPFYSFDFQNTHFIILDNSCVSSYENMKEEQISWLEEDLIKNQDKTNIYVFMHKPFWANAIGEGKNDPIHEIFKKYDVDAVFTGHWHQNAYEEIEGIEYFLCGSSGGSYGDKELIDLGLFYQFMWCHVKDDRLETTIIKSGSTYDKSLVTLEEEKLAYKIPSELIVTKCDIDDSDPNIQNVELEIINETPDIIEEKTEVLSTNWEISEPVLPVFIEPYDTLKIQFTISQKGDLFPLPIVKFPYPFGRNKIYPYEKPLKINRKIQNKKLEHIPQIDGIIKAGEWKNSILVDEFSDLKGNKAKVDNTEFYFSNDELNLYIAAVCDENNIGKLKAEKTERDDEVYYDDSIQFLLSQDENIIFLFYINPKGVIWDMRTDLAQSKYDLEWNGNIQTSCSILEKSWVAEIKIPLEELELDNNNKELKINFNRFQHHNERPAYFIPEWSYKSIRNGILLLK